MSFGTIRAHCCSVVRSVQPHPVWRTIAPWLRSPWFAYLMLFLFQLKVVWGIWEYRDVTNGDTSAYYASATSWFENGQGSIAWSPLYTAFYGSLRYLTANPCTVTLLHRLIIVFAVSMLMLALMRRLLAPSFAWLVAAWWAVLPINFNTLYEVHLFTVLPALAALLLVLYRPSRWTRAAMLAILCLGTVLVRNEFIVAAILWSLCCLGAEISLFRRRLRPTGTYLRPVLTNYGLALTGSVLVTLYFYQHSTVQFPQLNQEFSYKHTLNMAQVFCFGYQQRHPEWTRSPWTEYQDVMVQHFGKALPSFAEMIRANPNAVARHFLWNYRLAPNGIQVLLFNSTWGSSNPDYAPVKTKSVRALVLSLILVAIWVAGLCIILFERRYWWYTWILPRIWCWLGMFSLTAVAFLIIATQRPRPSYLFLLSILLMAVTGMCAFAVTRRCGLDKALGALMPLTMVLLVVGTPPYYPSRSHQHPLLLNRMVTRMMPYQSLIADPNAVVLQGEFSFEIGSYVGLGRCRIHSYALLRDWNGDVPLEQFLEDHAVTFFYLDRNLMIALQTEHPETAQAFLEDPPAPGWKLIGFQELSADSWRFYQYCTAENADICRDGLRLRRNWYPLETYVGQTFRWVNNDAEIILPRSRTPRTVLGVEVERGPGLGETPGRLQLLGPDGRPVATAPLGGHKQVQFDLPATAASPAVYRLHVEGGGRKVAGDPRVLNFRVFQCK